MIEYADLLDRLARVVLLGCAAWGVLLVACLVLDARTAGRVPALTWVGLSPALRRSVLGALGVVVASGVAGPAGALPMTRAPHPAPAAGLPVPTRVLAAPHAAPATTVLVRPGDTLWRLARDRLPPHADDADVARAVERWHTRNRALIGPDPDLILPGQRLRAPAEEHS